MAEITAAMVKELREKTDAPMMECKRALTEAGGDPEKAEEILRVKLGNKASKAASRVAAEGVVAIHISADQKLGAMVEVNCETDFVAKNDDFLALSAKLAEMVATQNPVDVAALSAMSIAGTSVEETRKALVGKIGENISIRRFVRVPAKGALNNYIHGGSKVGVLVDITGGDATLAKDVAMHIAASKPVALSMADVPANLVEKEREIARQKAAESGKPAEIVAKMVEGSAAKFMKEVALLSQPFVKDDKLTIEALMKSKGAAVNEFSLYVVGEGIEKKVTDFAAEVAEAAAAAAR
ncbi:MAG: translation elongation factor Ts [Burkholderiales bacterium]|nr:translation elongation factor Ts [Burkholderiales bacterium]